MMPIENEVPHDLVALRRDLHAHAAGRLPGGVRARPPHPCHEELARAVPQLRHGWLDEMDTPRLVATA